MDSFVVMALSNEGELREISAIDPGAQQKVAWYIFAYRGATLHNGLAWLLRDWGAERPDVGIVYGDEVVFDESNGRTEYRCKPAFDETQLYAQDYIGLPLALRRDVVSSMGVTAEAFGTGQFYELILRALTAGIGIERITEVLAVNPVDAQRVPAADRSAALRKWIFKHDGEYAILPGLAEGTLRLSYVFEDFPHVTLVVPTCQARCDVGPEPFRGRPMIRNLLDGLTDTDWPMDRLTVLIGDDVEDDAIYRAATWPFHVERIVTSRADGQGFNYARKVNDLWRRVRSEYLVIMNDDLVVRDGGWLQALMTFAVDERVGGVGARLLYPDDTIQHAGMPMGVLGPCTHAFLDRPASQPTYQHWAEVHREWSAVTGAVFATRRSLLTELNGFDERFSLDYNDVDLCLRMRLLGYRIVYTPFAELTHLESASRGRRGIPADQTALFMEKWQSFLQDDPSYHPKLTRTTQAIRPEPLPDEWWRRYVLQAAPG